MNSDKLTTDEKKELDAARFELIYRIKFALIFSLPTGVCVYVTAKEPEDYNIVPTMVSFIMLFYFISGLYKNAKTYNQLKRQFKQKQFEQKQRQN